VIRFGRAVCGNLAQAESREWWISNGLGGYAAGTIAGSLTRRYHGLFITPLAGALDRHLMFARAEATLEVDGQLYPLSCNRWQSGTIAPRGYVHIESFRLDGQLPRWVYSVAGVRLEQCIFMLQGEAAAWVAFRLIDSVPESSIHLHLRLLVNHRDHHGQTSSGGIHPESRLLNKRTLKLKYADSSALFIQLDSGELQLEHNWINGLLLPLEQQRGLPEMDNHLAVANARLTLNNKNWHGIRAGLQPGANPDTAVALKQEQLHQYRFLNRDQITCGKKAPDWIEQLALNSRQFLFKRSAKEGIQAESIIAGYPWFADWGRDTMIALPGLTLATGQLPLARRILETWSAYVDQGMIPNRFPESATSTVTPEYNSVDASLWFILAWYAYLQAGGEELALREVLPVLEQIIHAYQYGARYQIHLDESNGLLHIGETGTQLTWMDARVNGIAATPRTGKPVEINALWYNALMAMQNITERLGGNASNLTALAERARSGFQRYLRADGGLYDVLDAPGGNDASIRPNQVFALSLPWPLLDKTAANGVLNELHQHLYTSYGLRSLSPQDPAYRGVYQGGVSERDAAYHNGPVWGWLSGHYAMAHFRLHGDADAALALMEPMRDHLLDAGLGSISEIFDGDPPHQPRGAPSQAWSVATVLEAWCLIEGPLRFVTHH
jgi:predicted glycogen debranching enzyme